MGADNGKLAICRHPPLLKEEDSNRPVVCKSEGLPFLIVNIYKIYNMYKIMLTIHLRIHIYNKEKE